MAAFLAAPESSTDLAGGVSLSDRDADLAKVMLDMQLDWKIEESRLLGKKILDELGGLTKLHSERVEQAGFVVLRALAIPSVLVEVGYLTNRNDFKRLAKADHRQRLAASILRGIQRYCHSRPECPLLWTPNKVYKVRPGDSLSKIADRYHSSVKAIKQKNGLRDDVIHIGEELIIPILEP